MQLWSQALAWQNSPGLAHRQGLIRVAGEQGLWPRNGLQLCPRLERRPLLPWRAGPCWDDPPPSIGHPWPSRRRKPGSCIDPIHRRWAILIWKWKGPGSARGRSLCAPPPPPPAQPPAVAATGSRFTRWLRTWPGPGPCSQPPPPAPNWLICYCVNKGAAPPAV